MGWNVEYAKSISKADWIEQHKHHVDEFDLDAEYEAMVNPPKADKAKVEVKGVQTEFMDQKGADPNDLKAG